MISEISILLYGRDPHLLETRKLILRRAGYRVSTVTELEQINTVTDGETIDLLILCHSLTLEECGRAIAFCQCRWPFMKSLVVAAGGSWCTSGVSELVFEATQGPAKLLVTVDGLFNHESASHSY